MNVVIEKVAFQKKIAPKRVSATSLTSRYFIHLLLAAYVLAALLPSFGTWIRTATLGGPHGTQHSPSLSLMMLALLLFNAGLGLGREHFTSLIRRPFILFVALGVTLCVPAVMLLLLIPPASAGQFDELNSILAGLTLVAAMPIANASAAWSQNANANMAISLSLVCCSTFLAPVTAPLILPALGKFFGTGHQGALNQLASSFGAVFVLGWVVLPTVSGIVLRSLLGTTRMRAAAPRIRMANSINLLLLNYTHASAFLPKILADSQVRLLIVTLGAAMLFCAGLAAIGWITGGFLRADLPERIALMFGVGMKNNGVALVLASLFLAEYPTVSLTIVFCTLGQHLVAGWALAMITASRRRELDIPN